MLYRIVPLSMTLSDPEPQFQGHSIVYKANISQTVHPIHFMFGSTQGFRGRRIEWRYFRFNKIQDGG